MDKLTSMMVFTRVAKAGSFSSAADELGMSRAMVTKHVMFLEENLGVRLLNRTTRRLSITEPGSAYLERCLLILDEIEEIETSVGTLQSEPRGLLKIAAPPYFGTHHLIPAISDYHKLYPEVEFEVILRGRLVDVIEEAMDLAIHLDQLADSSLVARNIASSRLLVCGSPEYFAKFGYPKAPQELVEHNCLVTSSLPPGDVWPFKRSGEAPVSVRVSGSLRSNIAGAIKTAAISGIGLAVLPSYMVGSDLNEGRLQTVLTEYQYSVLNVNAVYPHRKFLSGKVRTFVDFLIQRYQPTPYWDEWVERMQAVF